MDDRKIDMPYRKQMRLKGYDYSQAGYYFVTICTLDRRETLGRIVGGDAHIAPSVLLSEIGAIADKYINNINKGNENAHVDKYVIMPNHIHMIIALENGAMWASPPTGGMAGASPPTNETVAASLPTDGMAGSHPYDHCIEHGAMWASPPTDGMAGASLPSDAQIPKIIRSLKTLVAKESGVSVFQKSYYDHIIRHEADYLTKWNYIDENPLRWADDEYCEAMTPI